VRPVGADVVRGALTLAAGQVLAPHAVSAIAAVGHDDVSCVRRPRALVLATGDELAEPGSPLRRGQIHDSNTTLAALTLERLGCEVVRGGRVGDDLAGTIASFERGAGFDLVVSTGGVSVGPRDHVKPALAALGADVLFWRVAIQPGKPIFASRLGGGALVLALPGNPLSALVGLQLLARPAIDVLLGTAGAGLLRASLAAEVRQLAGRVRALPSRLDDGSVRPLADASHQIARAATADALALIPRGDGTLAAGTIVDLVPIV